MVHVKWTGMTRFPQFPPPLHCFCAVLDDMSPPLLCLHPPPTHLIPTASQRLVSTTLQNFSSPSVRRGREGGITTVKLMLKTILCLTCMAVTCNVTHTIKRTFFSLQRLKQMLNLLCSKVHVPKNKKMTLYD